MQHLKHWIDQIATKCHKSKKIWSWTHCWGVIPVEFKLVLIFFSFFRRRTFRQWEKDQWWNILKSSYHKFLSTPVSDPNSGWRLSLATHYSHIRQMSGRLSKKCGVASITSTSRFLSESFGLLITFVAFRFPDRLSWLAGLLNWIFLCVCTYIYLYRSLNTSWEK